MVGYQFCCNSRDFGCTEIAHGNELVKSIYHLIMTNPICIPGSLMRSYDNATIVRLVITERRAVSFKFLIIRVALEPLEPHQ